MSYCTVSDIESLLPYLGTFTETSKPSRTQVEGYIFDKDSEMQGILLNLGVDPNGLFDIVTNRVLKMYCTYGVAAEVLRSGYSKDLEAAASYQTMYEKGMTSIKQGELQGLFNFEAGVSHAVPVSAYTRATSSEDYPEAKFRMGEDQW